MGLFCCTKAVNTGADLLRAAIGNANAISTPNRLNPLNVVGRSGQDLAQYLFDSAFKVNGR